MKNVGIICDLTYTRHTEFCSYYYALCSMYKNVILVKSKADLFYIDLLVIGDDHYDRHKELLQSPGFIGCINTLQIPVVVLTAERIFDSYFPWNEMNYQVLKNIERLYHHTADIDDCIKLNTSLHRISISKAFKDKYRSDSKLNGIVFIGSTKCAQGSYDNRKSFLTRLNKKINITIIDKEITDWKEYMFILSKYRFVLCPLGNSNFFPMRFYEALAVGSIPVQQITDKSLQFYDIESKFDDSVFFTDETDIKEKMNTCTLLTSHNEFWAEDNLNILLRQDKLL